MEAVNMKLSMMPHARENRREGSFQDRYAPENPDNVTEHA